MMRRKRAWKLAGLAMALGLIAAACSNDDDTDEAAQADDEAAQQEEDQEQPAAGGTLAQVRERGTLNCGVNDAVPGFGFVDEAGEFSGFDIEYCGAIAAAVLGDSEAVDFTPLTADNRFTVLQAGDVDVLVRNTTHTSGRDGTEGSAFATTTFYDGQGMMVRADEGITEVDELEGGNICVLSGTTTELNLTTRFARAGLDFTPQSFEDNDQLQEAFVQGQCDGWTSDKSQLAGVRSAFPEAEGGPESLVILDETFSKEPLGPVVRDGDDEWFDVVNWTVIATIQAEEFGITSDNVEEMRASDDPDIRRFLGESFEDETGATAEPFDPGLDLPVDFAAQVIEQVGNYGEIYDRNVGPGTPLDLERDLNALWTDGGLLYAPPYR
jgi:general L-amino acid transport system substrate-binding protein